MSAPVIFGLRALSQTLTGQEALSGILGSVSLATWIFLLIPQLIMNYKTGSADAISIGFLFIWLVGDVANLSGAVWADLVPTVIALAIYFCLADCILLGQTFYYNHINKKTNRQESVDSIISEEEPLLTRRRSSDTIGLPGSHRRRSSARSGRRDSLTKILEEDDSTNGNPWVKNSLSILAVIVIGTAGWAIAWQSGVWQPTPDDEDTPEAAMGAQILGYASAVAYLGARIPQIVKNYRDKSCEGLSLLFFLLSLMGNLTYGASILAHSLEKDYIGKNLPWLIGSLGTMIEDAIIFIQFRIYARVSSTEAVE